MAYEPYNDRQGRDNPHSVNASRAALGLPPLHRDEPIYSPEDVAEGVSKVALTVAIALAVAACMAIAAGALDPWLTQYLTR